CDRHRVGLTGRPWWRSPGLTRPHIETRSGRGAWYQESVESPLAQRPAEVRAGVVERIGLTGDSEHRNRPRSRRHAGRFPFREPRFGPEVGSHGCAKFARSINLAPKGHRKSRTARGDLGPPAYIFT